MTKRRSGPGALMLLDAASLYFRAFYGVPRTVTAPDGTPVNAVRGLLDMIAYLLQERRPARLVACWDEDWRPAFRVAAVPSYKAHRVGQGGASADDSPPELAVQVPIIAEALAAVGIARAGAAGLRGRRRDRHPGRQARPPRRAADRGGDRGPGPVPAGGRRVRGHGALHRPRACATPSRSTRPGCASGTECAPAPGYADMAVLRGDPSDGLPGVPGIGEKTAAGLLAGHGDLAGLLKAVEDPASGLSGAQRRKLTEAGDYLAVAPGVVLVARDAPVSEHDDAVPREPADPDAVLALAERWGLSSSLTRLVEAL